MSNTQFAFVSRSRVPDRAALQASIDALQFDLQLDPDFTPFEDSGFSPCILKGEEGFGFEIYYQEATEITEGDRELQEISGGLDHCISMVWSSSMKDLACAMIVSCSLAKDFGAVISYEGGPPESLEKMLSEIEGVLRDAEGEKPPVLKHAAPKSMPEANKPWWKFW